MTGPVLDETHDPARRSWIESANAPDSDFPIQNLPFGVFSESAGARRVGVAIGELILDLTALEAQGRIASGDAPVFAGGSLNPFMARPRSEWARLRTELARMLDAGASDRDLPLVAQSGVEMHLPVRIGGFTDFYASREHATNVGSMFRDPENALLPNWLHIPIGYNGRASTVVVSGTPVTRPLGQLKAQDADAPRVGPSRKLDIEVELGALVGTPTQMGRPIGTAEAQDSIFGYVLLNDWSARDIQVWEYQPLGPFLSKAFATTVSPWVVTSAALEPFRREAPKREKPLLPYLQEATPNNLDIEITATLAPAWRRPGADPSHQCQRALLFDGAAACASYPIGVPDGDRRSSGVRHHIGPHAGQLRLIARTDVERDGAHRDGRRHADIPGRWGHSRADGHVQRVLPHRLRRLHRNDPARARRPCGLRHLLGQACPRGGFRRLQRRGPSI
jgi:fumarylacetoacetase